MDHPCEEIKVQLSMDICCLPCENKLREKLMKIAGKVTIDLNTIVSESEFMLGEKPKSWAVFARVNILTPHLEPKQIPNLLRVRRVHTYVDENLVSVIGKMDTTTLLGRLEKAGKRVKVISCDKYTEKKDELHRKSNVRMGGGHGCRSHEAQHEPKKEEEAHKCEPYVFPTVDQRICRSYYCPDHQKLRKLLNRVPEEKSSFFGGGLYEGCDGYCGGGPCNPYGYPQSYTNGPMYPRSYPNMNQFGHIQPPRMRPFGFL